MKVLLDTCVWGGTKEKLVSIGHDVIWAGDWDSDPGDEEILEIAQNDQRVLIILDKDFGELAVVHGKRHSGIVRLVSLSANEQGDYCEYILNTYQSDLEKGAIITAQQERVRIRPAEG